MSGQRSISGATRLAASIGTPIRHSLSPALHNAAFAAGGLDWVYVALEVAAGGVEGAFTGMRALGIGGFSVTMPHKDDAARLVDELDPAAAALGSCNTIVPLPDGRLSGYSTDGAGFVASLREAGIDPAGAKVAVLGAGGAARAVVDAITRAGAKRVAVINRTADKAAVAAALAGRRGVVGKVGDLATADLVVNATSIGMGTNELPCEEYLLDRDQVIADLVYHPLETALLRVGRAKGATVVDGLGMLVHQAVLQQELWTGVRPDPAVMRAAALAELARRERNPAPSANA